MSKESPSPSPSFLAYSSLSDFNDEKLPFWLNGIFSMPPSFLSSARDADDLFVWHFAMNGNCLGNNTSSNKYGPKSGKINKILSNLRFQLVFVVWI